MGERRFVVYPPVTSAGIITPQGGRVFVSDSREQSPGEALDATDSPTATHLRIPLTGGAYLEQARRQLFARHPEYLPYLLQRLAISPGMTVIEVGCGTGAYTRLIASVLAGKGAVIGIDTQPVLLAKAFELAKQEGWGETHHLRGRRARQIARSRRLRRSRLLQFLPLAAA